MLQKRRKTISLVCCIMFWDSNFLLLPEELVRAFFVVLGNFPWPEELAILLSQRKANSNVKYRSSSWAVFLWVQPLKMSRQVLTVVLSNPISHEHYLFSLGDIHYVCFHCYKMQLDHSYKLAFEDRGGQEKEKNKEQPNNLQYCYFQEPQELFCSFSLKFLHFSCWQSLKDYLAMGVEERTLCLCFCPASHVFSRDPCLIVLATVLWYESYGKILVLCFWHE